MAVQMHDELKAELAKVRETRAFDVKKWVDQKTDMFNDYLNKNGLKAACVSLSGGVDSAVTFALMLHAAKKVYIRDITFSFLRRSWSILFHLFHSVPSSLRYVYTTLHTTNKHPLSPPELTHSKLLY